MFCACTKEIPLKQEDIKTRLVAFSFFNPDSLWMVELSKSSSIFKKDSIYPVSNAKVILKDANQNLLEILQEDNSGIYSSANNKPVKNQSYYIEIEAEGYETIKAGNRVPGDCSIEVDTIVTKNDYGAKVEVKLHIDDNIDEENYYIISCNGKHLYKTGETIVNNELMVTKDLNIERSFQSLDSEIIETEILLRDENFNGGRYTLRFSLELYPGYSMDVDSFELAINVKSTTEEHFLYRLSLDKYYVNDGDPFSTPVKVYSNFENGLGVFAGYNWQKTTLDLSYLIEFFEF